MTPAQARCLTFIGDYTAEHGYSPSFDDIAHALGLKSKSGVARLVRGLVAAGKLRSVRYRARSLEVVGSAVDGARLAIHLTVALNAAHGFHDGDEQMIVCTLPEAHAALLAALRVST